MLEGGMPLGSLAVEGDPAWQSFWGSMHDKEADANAQGQNFRADLGGIGRPPKFSGGVSEWSDPTQAGDAGGLTPREQASIGANLGLGQLTDMRRARALAEQRANIGDMQQSYDEHVLNSVMQPKEEASITTTTEGLGATQGASAGPFSGGRPNVRAGDAYSIAQVRDPNDTRSARQRALERMPGAARMAMEAAIAPLEQKDRQQTALEEHQKSLDETARIAAGEGATNVSDAVAGMKEGTLPPILPGRATKDYVKLLSEARRQGYDLAGAATDWTATQKHIASLNSTQQLRLNEAIGQLPELLDTVESLGKQWKANAKLPILNKANILLAKNGAMGPEAASIANRLSTQIADVTADLGTVYMGGNSPTDHALKLAGTALNENWDEKVLTDMVNQARQNVRIRQNSIRNTGVAGASATNPYAPKPEGTPAAGGGQADLVWDGTKFVKPGAPK
jgi:hypothetical protein